MSKELPRHFGLEVQSILNGNTARNVHPRTPFATRMRIILEVVRETFLHPISTSVITNDLDRRNVRVERI